MIKKRKSVYRPDSDAKWIRENKEHKRYLSSRSSARSFIRNKATYDDLNELSVMINENVNVEDRSMTLKEINNIIRDVMKQHPYKVVGEYDTYSDYNQGWEDACYEIEDIINAKLGNFNR